jgi:hypothetical protein
VMDPHLAKVLKHDNSGCLQFNHRAASFCA